MSRATKAITSLRRKPLNDDLLATARDIWHVDKDEQGNVTKEKQFGVMYVPLTDRDKQWK